MTENDLTTPSSTDLFTARELAAAFKVTVAGVRAWQGQGMPAERLGRLCRYRLADVIDWHRRRTSERQVGRAKVAFCAVRVPGAASAFALKRPKKTGRSGVTILFAS